MSTTLLPQIDPILCTGCRRCVDVCPMHALDMVEGKAVLHSPDRCDACSVCDHICPEGAISLPFQIVFAPSQSTDPKKK